MRLFQSWHNEYNGNVYYLIPPSSYVDSKWFTGMYQYARYTNMLSDITKYHGKELASYSTVEILG